MKRKHKNRGLKDVAVVHVCENKPADEGPSGPITDGNLSVLMRMVDKSGIDSAQICGGSRLSGGLLRMPLVVVLDGVEVKTFEEARVVIARSVARRKRGRGVVCEDCGCSLHSGLS